MRESQAWRILSEEHDAGRTPYTCLCDNLRFVDDGEITRVAKIPATLRDQMRARIASALDGEYAMAYPYISSIHPDRDELRQEQREGRVLACLMFAEQAKDEERAQRASIGEDLRASAEIPF